MSPNQNLSLPDNDEEKPAINSSPGWDGSDVPVLPGEHPDRGEDMPYPTRDPWVDDVERNL